MDPVFIPSKGRAGNCNTHRNFEAYDMHDWVYVVEPQEYWDYVQRLRRDGIYKPETHVYAFDVETFKSPKTKDNPLGYDYLDDYGWRPDLTTGPGPARNALHQLAKRLGYKHYWMLDDDIATFSIDAFFFQKNLWTKNLQDGGPANRRFSLIDTFEMYENLLDKFSNIGLAELDKQGLVQNHRKNCHFSVNCKAYSCIRFSTDIDIPWRSRYNDDIMISLDYEKRGFVNVSSKVITYATPSSQQQSGGMTEAFHQEGTLRKVKYLVKAYPEHSFFILRYGRFHHMVDYSHFNQTLSRKNGIEDLSGLLPEDWDPYDSFVPINTNLQDEFQKATEEAREAHWKNIDDLMMAMYADEQISRNGYFGDGSIPQVNIPDLIAADTEKYLGLKRKNELPPTADDRRALRNAIAKSQEILLGDEDTTPVPAIIKSTKDDLIMDDDGIEAIEKDEDETTGMNPIEDETVIDASQIIIDEDDDLTGD